MLNLLNSMPVRKVGARKAVTLALGAMLGLGTLGTWAGADPGAGDHRDLDLRGIFAQACDLYGKGDFASAIERFEAIKAAGVENAAVYYNMGNCYYREGQLGRAAAGYRRALMLAPRDADARANLALIRTAVGYGDTTITDALGSAVASPLRLFSARQFQTVFYLAYYLAAACLLCTLFLRGRARRISLYSMVAAALVAGLTFGLYAHGVSQFRSASDGVVVADRAELKSGPGDAFQEIATLADGLELKLRARSGIWVEVQLLTGEVGWLRDTDLEPI